MNVLDDLTLVTASSNAIPWAVSSRTRSTSMLIRSIFGAGYFNVAQMDYNQFQMNLYQGDASTMNLVIKYPGSAGTITSQTYPMQNKSY